MFQFSRLEFGWNISTWVLILPLMFKSSHFLGPGESLCLFPHIEGKGTTKKERRAWFFPWNTAHGPGLGSFYHSCKVSFGWLNFAASFIICRTCGYTGRGGERVTVKLLEWLANTNYILVVRGWLTLQHQKPLLFQALTRYHFAVYTYFLI